MKSKEIIEECWTYDIDYYDEYEKKISYISHFDEMAIEHSLETDSINIYRFFSFYDDSYGDDGENARSHIMQEAYSIYLEQNTCKGWKSICDEDSMCPGGNILIGFFDVLCSRENIEDFLKLNRGFDLCITDEKNAIDYVISYYTKKLPIWYRKGFGCVYSSGQYDLTKTRRVERPFVGTEYCLIKLDDKVYGLNRNLYEQVIGDMECINYGGHIFYVSEDAKLIIQGNYCYAKIVVDLQDEKRCYAEVEEAFLIQRINLFSNFASDRLQGFSEYYLREIPEVSGENINIPLIITEGMTDWMYIDWAWKKVQSNEKLREKYKDTKFGIYRYASANYSGQQQYPKLQMDSNALLAMCQSYAKLNSGLYIFISDRDVDANVKQMSANGTYKKWGNGVYSFVLPIPEIRKSNPDICIEHYFSDEEIKTVKTFPDGTERRLYLSSEFDQYGRAPKINRFCINRNACCEKKKIKILDGTGNDKIINLNDTDDQTNYGLSKMEFANSVISDPAFENIGFENFLLIFNLIQKICKDITSDMGK